MASLFSKPKVPEPEPPAPMPDPYNATGKRAETRKLAATSSTAQNKLAATPGTIGREYSRTTLG
jgi:hypothetical protein